MEGTLLVLLLILFVGLVVPELFRKLRLPFITSLILMGAVFGSHGLDMIPTNETIEFFSFLGLTFLMFMSGLETRIEQVTHSAWKVLLMALLNGGLPALAGYLVATAFGYDTFSALVVAVIFISSSVAIIIPSLKEAGMFKKLDGQLIVSAVVLEDVVSLVLLGLLLQSVSPITSLPLPLYIVVLIGSIIGLKMVLPRLARLITKRGIFGHKEHEDEIRFAIVLLMAVLLFFSILGVHPIVAAFLLGLVMSSTISSPKLFTQLHTIGYGLFVPVFFFMIGTQIDFTVFFNPGSELSFLLSLICVSIVVKYLSGYLAGRMAGISKEHSAIFGVASTIQVTAGLAASQAAFSLGIIDTTMLTSMVMLAIVTTVISPLILRALGRR